MADAELSVEMGTVKFHGKGPQDWLTDQMRYVFESGRHTPSNGSVSNGDQDSRGQTVSEENPDLDTVGVKTSRWMKQHDISRNQLEQLFFPGRNGIEISASVIPGNSKQEKTLNSYFLTGAKALLEKDEPYFDDKEARAICDEVGCFDSKHHVEILKGAKNRISGSKESGWRLTAPGLEAAAALIKLVTI